MMVFSSLSVDGSRSGKTSDFLQKEALLLSRGREKTAMNRTLSAIDRSRAAIDSSRAKMNRLRLFFDRSRAAID
jgi:hypothetical protein